MYVTKHNCIPFLLIPISIYKTLLAIKNHSLATCVIFIINNLAIPMTYYIQALSCNAVALDNSVSLTRNKMINYCIKYKSKMSAWSYPYSIAARNNKTAIQNILIRSILPGDLRKTSTYNHHVQWCSTS